MGLGANRVDDIGPDRYLEWVAGGGALAEKGIEGLFRLYASRIKAFFRRHRMSDEEAADLLQETFVKVYRGAASFSGGAKPSTWIWSIARNCMLDQLRSKRPTESLDAYLDADMLDIEAVTDAACIAESIGMRDCIERGFAAFSIQHPERASVMRLAVFEEWEIDEVAEFLARTPAATREYLSQCRKRLRVFLEPCRDLMGS
jgi:RNA polymerase sigma-70 factor (ECF subfamily)